MTNQIIKNNGRVFFRGIEFVDWEFNGRIIPALEGAKRYNKYWGLVSRGRYKEALKVESELGLPQSCLNSVLSVRIKEIYREEDGYERAMVLIERFRDRGYSKEWPTEDIRNSGKNWQAQAIKTGEKK